MVPDLPSRALAETNHQLWTQHGVARSLQHHRSRRTVLPPPHSVSPLREPKGNCPWSCESNDAVKRSGLHLWAYRSYTHSDHFPSTPSWVSGCIHLASDQWLQQHFRMEDASRNPISAATQEILKLWPVLLPSPPIFSPFSAKYWWHCGGLESQMQPELRKHYKSICSNIYSEIFHATPTTDFSLLRTWCTGEGQTTWSIYCCQAKYH